MSRPLVTTALGASRGNHGFGICDDAVVDADDARARPIGDRLAVSSVHTDSDAWWAGVRPGMTLVTIEGEDKKFRTSQTCDLSLLRSPKN